MAEKKASELQSLIQQLNNIKLDDINNIDWENMGSWPILGKIAFCLLLVALILAGGYFYVVSDTIDELHQTINKEQTLKQEFVQKANKIQNLDAYKEQLEQMNETFGALLQQLPRDTEVPGLLDDISAAASGSGLSLSAINPQPLVRTEFYNELPISIEVSGGYHEIGTFVSAISSLPRIVTLHDFSIEKSAKEGSLKMQLLAKTYQYIGDAAKTGGAK
ncbi:MAG: type 4a pilus biogenesis protein PilO [Venatoribacter sp.]